MTNGHGLPGREQSDNGGVTTVREWGGGRDRRTEIDRISVKAFTIAMNSPWCQFIRCKDHSDIAMSRF